MFSDAQPTESEKDVYKIVEYVLAQARDILTDLQTYKGAGSEIREVILIE